MSFILFLSKMIFVSGVLYSHYWFFLRNKKFHQYNRFFLLSIPVLAISIPLLNIPLPGFYGANPGAGIKLLKAVSVSGWENEVVITPHRNWMHSLFSWQNTAVALYTIILSLLLCMLLRSLFRIIRLSGKYLYEKINGIKFYQTPEPGTPFSFLNNIFWNDKIDMKSKKGNQILRHELYHVKQKHTTDILFMELLCAVSWFNPFFHLIKKELKAVHEFLADQYAASATNNHDYAELLVWESVAIYPLKISNPFFNNQIKRRITMITQSKNTRFGYIRRLMALPLLFILFCAFGVKLNQQIIAHPLFHNKSITIVVDAGHGGIFSGATGRNGILEKDLDLSIARKIQQLGKDYNVNVVMTRDKDATVENSTSLKEDLQNRVKIAESGKADLFISIHMNADVVNPSSRNGFEIWLSDKNAYYQQSKVLGSALTDEIKNTYNISSELKQPPSGVTVLKVPRMPSVLIECGYITNKDDLAFITNEENQEKIARNILEGVVKYSNATPITATIQENKIQDTLPVNTGKVFRKVEVEADYSGGANAWVNYLNKNLKYPQEAINKEMQGTVLARFIVNLDGTLSDLKIIKSPGKILSEETIRVIRNSGNWIPATNKGQRVKAYKIQPVVYKLERQ